MGYTLAVCDRERFDEPKRAVVRSAVEACLGTLCEVVPCKAPGRHDDASIGYRLVGVVMRSVDVERAYRALVQLARELDLSLYDPQDDTVLDLESPGTAPPCFRRVAGPDRPGVITTAAEIARRLEERRRWEAV